MHNNIIQTSIANNNFAIIACFTGEYCFADFNYCSEDGTNYPEHPAWDNIHSDETFSQIQDILHETGWDCILAIPINELQAYFDKILQSVKDTFEFANTHNGHLGDDTFYDYLPDAQFMLGQIAYHINRNDSDKDFNKLMKPLKLLIERYDAQWASDTDELLIDQLYSFDEIETTIQSLNNF